MRDFVNHYYHTLQKLLEHDNILLWSCIDLDDWMLNISIRGVKENSISFRKQRLKIMKKAESFGLKVYLKVDTPDIGINLASITPELLTILKMYKGV